MTTGSGEGVSLGRMESIDGEMTPLKSLAIMGEVRGSLFTSRIRQVYRNEGSRDMEAVYTFPLAWGTVLLGLSAEIGGKRLEGSVVAKKDAEMSYEKSVSEGDSAILVQKSADGLFTANLGNIRPGETVAMELRCIRPLDIGKGRIRLCVPTVIGERYGEQHGAGGLAPHESVAADPAVRHPFSLEILLREADGKNVSCPTHPIRTEAAGDGVRVILDGGAMLDRDFILIMDGVAGESQIFAVPGGEEGENAAVAIFTPAVPGGASSPLGMKILVDCSGSMGGERIDQAQEGLRRVLAQLRPDDLVSYSRFGSCVRHTAGMLQPCTPENLATFSQAVEKTWADLGGTEMAAALRSAIADIRTPDKDVPLSILLITDGDIWETEDVIRTARQSGHRIFAIGVGSAPAESLLRRLAEQSGGACELVTPGESMADAVVRMVGRMRAPAAHHVSVDWGQEPLWSSEPPRCVYDGETVRCFACLRKPPERAPILTWKAGGETLATRADAVETVEDPDILRLIMARRMEAETSKTARQEIALRHQLVGDRTSLILTCVRAEDDKAQGLPQVRHVRHMPAAGHGLLSSAAAGAVACCLAPSPMPFIAAAVDACAAPVRRMFGRNAPSGSDADGCLYEALDDTDGRLYEDADPSTPPSQEEIAALWIEAAAQGSDFAECLARMRDRGDLSALDGVFAELADRHGVSTDQVWAICVLLAMDRADDDGNRRGDRFPLFVLKGVGEEKRMAVRAALEEVFA